MRARFTHEGALDHHAHNEHELFRRAEAALERQRRLEQQATLAPVPAASVSVPTLPRSHGIPSPVETPSVVPVLPKIPQIAESVTTTSLGHADVANAGWPMRISDPRPITAHTHGRRLF